jgi:hypothetical protein
MAFAVVDPVMRVLVRDALLLLGEPFGSRVCPPVDQSSLGVVLRPHWIERVLVEQCREPRPGRKAYPRVEANLQTVRGPQHLQSFRGSNTPATRG